MEKRLLLSIFLLLCGFNLLGQELGTDSLIMGVPDTLSFTRDTVALSGPFGEEATTQAVIGTENMTLTSSTEVGHTAGQLSVSPSGGATYAVPIAVPPGINGVQPEIAVVYNSQGGNGLAGWGWNLSGVSVITRISSTRFHDNGINEVNFDQSDRFALDGQRLLLKSGTYGANGAQYETENYSNIKITSHGVSPFGATYGPAYFKVTYPDGSFAYYGNNTNSRSRTDFAITYWQNPQGLRVSYTYILANNGLAVSSIKYGAKGTATPVNEIQFIYKGRKRPEQAYVGGVSFIRKNILSEIRVKGNGTGYRNYVLSHDETSLGYQRLTSIQEKSGDNTKSYDLVVFSYTHTAFNVVLTQLLTNLSVGNIEQRNAGVVSLDYSGEGKMDFLVYPKATMDKFWLFTDLQNNPPLGYPVNTGKFESIFPVTSLSSQSRILTGQGLALVQKQGNSTVKVKVIAYSSVNPAQFQYEREWNSPVASSDQDCDGGRIESEIHKDYLPGDFNGDGLTDLIAVTKPYPVIRCYPVPDCNGALGSEQLSGDTLNEAGTDQDGQGATMLPPPPPDDPCCDCTVIDHNSSSVYFINLDRRVTSGFVSNAGQLQQSLLTHGKLLTGDVNGDGKTDIIHLHMDKAYVYTLDNNNSLILLWQTTNARITTDFPALLGDYNGDGKTDMMFPVAADSYTFALFSSTGKGFVKSEVGYPFQYKEIDWDGSAGSGTLYGYNLIPVDMNGDGKTDILDYRTTTYNGSSSGTQTATLYENTWPTSIQAVPAFKAAGSRSRTGNLKHFPIPIFLSSDRPNHNLDFASISDRDITSFQFLKDHREDALLRSVLNHGVTHNIQYLKLDPSDTNTNSEGVPVYSATLEETYPYVDIAIAPSTKVVSELHRNGMGQATKQLFYYHGGVSHSEGLGFLGFKRTTSSNWHTSFDDRIFHTTIHDPALRGAVIKEFTSEDAYISNSIQNADPNPSNATLSAPSTGTKTILASQSVTLLPGFSADGADGTFIARTDAATGTNDGATLSDYITRTDYKYQTQLRANKVFVNVPTEVSTKDQLSGTNTARHFTYDSYYNPTKEITYFSGQGSKEVNITYANSTGSTYYIGRPVKKITVSRAGGDVFSTEEQYTYTGYLPTQVKSKGHNTSFITETRGYDTYGNLTSKTVALPGETARATSFVYDASGRFLTESTDVEGLTTTYQYNLSTGNVTKETSPYNQSTDYTYDPWGRSPA